jgi:peptidyl-prolyl cis-trans isomerase SurA
MLKKLSLATLACLLFAVVLRADIVDEIIARVDNAIITRADYEKAKQTAQNEMQQQFPGEWQAKWAEREKSTLRELIDQQLLLEKGKELGITGDSELTKRLYDLMKQMKLHSLDDLEEEAKKQGISYEDFKESIRTGVVAEQVIGKEVGSHIHISNEDVQAWYNQHQKELDRPEEVSLSEILVSTQPAKASLETKDNQTPATDQSLPEDPAKIAEAEAKAKGLVEQLRKGAKFEDVAKQSSDGPTAAEGGTLGIFKRGELAKEFEDQTFGLKQGEFTDPIRTKQGFIILKVNGHRAAGIPPLKDVEERIKEAIYSEKLEPAARAYLTKLREEAYIEIKEGYVDTGASPNQSSKPILLAAAAPGTGNAKSTSTAKKKKKVLGVF